MKDTSDDVSDAELVAGALCGRLDCFGVLYERYYGRILALSYARLGNRHAAEDAVQEIFAVACASLASLKDRSRFAPWLAGICRNITKQMLRKASRTFSLHAEAEVVAKTSGCGADLNGAIRAAVWKLSLPERELVLMRYFDDLSQAKIAEALGISPAAVNSRLTRAKRKIASYLRQTRLGE